MRDDLGSTGSRGGNGGSGGLVGHSSVVNIIATKQKPNFQTINNAAEPGKAGVKGKFGHNGERGDILVIHFEKHSTSFIGLSVGESETENHRYEPVQDDTTVGVEDEDSYDDDEDIDGATNENQALSATDDIFKRSRKEYQAFVTENADCSIS